MRLAFLLSFIFFSSPPAWSGSGWVSVGGGNLYRSDKNPWFLRNTAKVHYCIARDGKGISAGPDQVRESLRQAIDYWLAEFEDSRTIRVDSSTVKTAGGAVLGTQIFEEGDCDGREDLRFVLGAGALNPEQRKFVGDVRRQLGLTVRTHYDEVELRGRGFVFVASDVGPEAFVDVTGRKIWSQKNLLKLMFAHELGHVFGIAHFGTGLMSEIFAEKIVSSHMSFMYTNLERIPGVLKSPARAESCPVDERVLGALGVSLKGASTKDGTVHCLELNKIETIVNPTDGAAVYELFAIEQPKKGPPRSRRALGRLFMRWTAEKDKIQFPLEVNVRTISNVFLNPGQKVFAPEELLTLPDPQDLGRNITVDYLYGAAEVSMGLPCTIELGNGTSKSCHFQFSPAGLRLVTDVEGTTRLIFNSDYVYFF